jgi:hypothetical protein
MSDPESVGDAPKWFKRDLSEEAERVQRHIEMLQDMLTDDHSDIAETPQVTTVRISFGRIFEDGDMQIAGEEEHLGTLLGVRLDSEPSALIAGYEVWQHGPVGEGEDGEPEWSTRIQNSDLAEIPVRLINDLWGATGTYEDFKALQDDDGG